MATKHFENGIVSTSSGGDSIISSDIFTTGVVTWVDSVNGNDSNAGTEESPLATLSAAITAATASNGDIIILKAGHSETLTSSLSLSKAGLHIFGLGSASTKPSFTVNGNVDMFSIGAAYVWLYNLRFPAGTNAHTARINCDAANIRIENCDFICGANDLESITVTANADHLEVVGSTFTVSADGPDAAIEVEAVMDGLKVNNCTFDGGSYGFDAGAINSAVAHVNYRYINCTLTNYADISHTDAAKGIVSGVVAGDGSHVEV